jgi:TonB-dependent SusC/RagA subfamily outer membrane receptor
MKKKIAVSVISSICLFFFQLTSAQMPQLTVDGKSNNGVVLQNLQIEIKVCGTVAKTTWQMVFKNNTSKLLEGTLNFPLKEGVSVSRYALDINGKMREAVPVDRGKGAMVFEAIERRRVDPGLLEKVDGNTFRTRIYPINANSTRTVVIGYEEELPLLENDLFRYYMPLNLKDTIADFLLNIEVIQSQLQPVFDTALSDNLQFDKRNNLYTASLHKINYVPEHSLSFSIQKPQDATDVMLQEFENNYYYLINTRLEKAEQEKALPQNITLLWDASLSGANRNLKKEMELLDAYFKKLHTAGVTMIVFGNKVYSNKKYTLQNGNWNELKNAIDSIQYDGATNLGCLDLTKLAGDEFLLLSDGHQTFGNNNIRPGSKQVYCINSAANADYSNLKFIALKTGGELIDLQKDGLVASLKKLTIVPLRFMGIQQNNAVAENYPSLQVAVGDNFSATGIAGLELKEIVLQFGYGNKITLTKKIAIDPEKQLCENFDITKVFAQKKISELDIQYEANKTEIENLGRRFGIITRNTSLIVLETVNDYLQYDIEPPAELRAEYDRVIKQRTRALITKKEDNLATSLEMMEELKSWWRTVKRPAMLVVKAPVIATQPAVLPVAGNNGIASNPSGSLKTIVGTISDANGQAIAGVTVKTKSGQTATVSDVHGNFILPAKQGDVLQYSGIGFIGLESRISNSLTVHAILHPAESHLEEVVVTGYAVQRKRDLTGSVTTISSDNINPIVLANPGNELQGRVAGVQVTNSNASPGASPTIRIRGTTTVTGSQAPIYIIDGVPGNLDDVDKDDIKGVQVLNGTSATAIYGESASNGVVIVTTKNRTSMTTDTIREPQANNNSTGAIELSTNKETTDYIKIIKAANKVHRYEKYLELRKYYIASPVYFFEVASYFIKIGDKETGIKILSNLAEMETGSYELYKMLGYKLKESGDYDEEVIAFKKVIELRPLDPQSYRDYALALDDAGHHQQALDQLYEGMSRSYSDEMKHIYEGIEEIFLLEINRLIAMHPQKLNLKAIPKAIIHPMPVDLRVVMNWNMNNTDIDLWVTDPGGEKCYYSHSSTEQGGRISNDFTDGLGPEQFILKNAMKGKYRIEIDYFGDHQATMAGPTTVMAEIYLHYGMPNEEKRTITLQMEKGKSGAVFIGEVTL